MNARHFRHIIIVLVFVCALFAGPLAATATQSTTMVDMFDLENVIFIVFEDGDGAACHVDGTLCIDFCIRGALCDNSPGQHPVLLPPGENDQELIAVQSVYLPQLER